MKHHVTARFLLLHCCLSLLCLVPLIQGVRSGSLGPPGPDDEAQLPRRIFDDARLFCPKALPTWRYGSREPPQPNTLSRAIFDALDIDYPPHWSFLNFTSLTNLCSTQGRFGANYGGQCISRPRSNPPRQPWFDVHMARRLLLFDGITARYCMENCKCPLTDHDRVAYELEERIFEMGIPAISTWTNPPTYDIDWPEATDGSDDEDDIPSSVLLQGLDTQRGSSLNVTHLSSTSNVTGISLPRTFPGRINANASRFPIQRCVKVARRPSGRGSPAQAIAMRPAPKPLRVMFGR